MMRRKICMVAGETSADRHAAAVIMALKETLPDVEVFGIGGPEMRKAGMECLYGIEEFSVMGFSDVVPKAGRIFAIYKNLKKAIKESRPDVVVPIDLPDFNMSLAASAKRTGARVLYYIAPQAWAWRSSRAVTLARITDGLAVIFPFEEAFFSSYGVNARYVGHPFMEDLTLVEPAAWPPRRIVLLPGSRRHEVETILPPMLGAKRIVSGRHPDVSWSLRVAPGIDEGFIRAMADEDIKLTSAPAPADLAVVKSGTSSLEMAIAGVPEVICYRTSRLNYLLARAFVRVEHIGMPNLILGRSAVPELIQDDLTPENLARSVMGLIEDEGMYRAMQRSFVELRDRLGASRPSRRVAEWIQSLMA